ncbi:hypothetical protein BDV35DRAFT_351277 [Aspergillus flavus]|uniref:Uncharacterized protein n=1 Tax=Aspergillus flavus TaxID=5059 RepID=A0A5N6GYE5_ASPFL|nr:hypothetical protein BDV35DRAFT_351277 [Aspergillus flavus]
MRSASWSPFLFVSCQSNQGFITSIGKSKSTRRKLSAAVQQSINLLLCFPVKRTIKGGCVWETIFVSCRVCSSRARMVSTKYSM